MLLYKYKSFSNDKSLEYALDSIFNKYLYFSRPSELNDPFDCQIKVSTNASNEEIQTWINLNQYKMTPNSKLSTVESFKNELNNGELKKKLQSYAQLIVETNHILSLTSDCFNESMWGLYAGNYNGICIGYNLKNPEEGFIPTKILFSDAANNIFDIKYNKFIPFEKIEYDNDGSNQLEIIKNRDAQLKNVFYNLTHKKNCWNTEKEYRAIFHTYDLELPPNPTWNAKIYYEDALLDEIIFGYKTSPIMINTVIELINQNYSKQIAFYMLSPNLSSYKLEKIPITMK